MFELHVGGEIIRIDPDRTINVGYSGRNQEAVQEHIDELVEEGVSKPKHVPSTYPTAPYTLLVDPELVQVVGPDTSGEAEFGLVFAGNETYVIAASDHTDRALETESIPKSKQIAPNVISRRAWSLNEVRDHWDDIELRSWNTVDGERRLYQNATLEEILPPDALIQVLSDRYGGQLAGTVLLSGTVAAGEIEAGSRFEVELMDPKLNRSIGLKYDVRSL